MENEPDDVERAEETRAGVVSEDRVEAKIDRDLADTFPASDPPGWVLGVESEREDEEADDASTPPAAE